MLTFLMRVPLTVGALDQYELDQQGAHKPTVVQKISAPELDQLCQVTQSAAAQLTELFPYIKCESLFLTLETKKS